MDTVLEQVTVGRAGAAPVATIDGLTLTNGLKPAAGGRLDTAQRYALDGVSFTDPDRSGTIAADRIVIDAGSDSTDARAVGSAAVALAKRLAKLPDYPRPLPGMRPDSDFGDLLRARPLLDKLLDGMAAGGRHETRIEGLRATIPDGTIRIGGLTFRLVGSGLDRETGTITASPDVRDMTDEPTSPYTAWVPTEATIQVSGQNLPLRALIADLMLPGEPDAKRLGTLLRGTQARLLIGPLRLAAPEGLLELSGALWSSGERKQVMTGRLDLRLAGLDALLKALQADPDPQAAEVVAGLSVLQVLGRQTTLPDGRAARDYEIVLDPERGLLVNNTDVRELVRELIPEPR